MRLLGIIHLQASAQQCPVCFPNLKHPPCSISKLPGALQLIDTPNGSEMCEWDHMELGNGRQNWQQRYQALVYCRN